MTQNRDRHLIIINASHNLIKIVQVKELSRSEKRKTIDKSSRTINSRCFVISSRSISFGILRSLYEKMNVVDTLSIPYSLRQSFLFVYVSTKNCSSETEIARDNDLFLSLSLETNDSLHWKDEIVQLHPLLFAPLLLDVILFAFVLVSNLLSLSIPLPTSSSPSLSSAFSMWFFHVFLWRFTLPIRRKTNKQTHTPYIHPYQSISKHTYLYTPNEWRKETN